MAALSWRGRAGWLGTSCIASFHKDTMSKATHGRRPPAQCLSCCLCECDAANWLMCDWCISHDLASFLLREWWLLAKRKAKYMEAEISHTHTNARTRVIQDKTPQRVGVTTHSSRRPSVIRLRVPCPRCRTSRIQASGSRVWVRASRTTPPSPTGTKRPCAPVTE